MKSKVSNFLLPAYSLARREVVRFLRQRSRVLGGLATPVLFWLLLGSGLGRSFRWGGESEASTGGYLAYLFSGTLVMIVLFTAIFSTISLIEDRHEGFLQGVLASPAPRLSIVAGKVLGASLLATGQAAVFLLAAPFAGVELSAMRIVASMGILLVLSVGLSAMGLAVAWMFDSIQGFHAVMNLVMMPMWILSGAVFPSSGASAWLRWVMAVNPLTYGVALVRGTLEPTGAAAVAVVGAEGSPSAAICWVVTLCFAAAMLAACTRFAMMSGREKG